MKKLFALFVLIGFSLAGYNAQAQECRLMRDSIIAGNRVSSYTDYIYAGGLLAQVSHVDSGQVSPSQSEIVLYTGSDISQIRTVTHWGGGDTVRMIITYTYSAGKISRIDVVGDTATANAWSISHDVTYDGNGHIQNIILDQNSVTGSPKGIPASFTDITWSNGNISSLNLVLGPDTIELAVTETDTKKSVYKHTINQEGASYLFLAASTNNIKKVALVNDETINGDNIPAGTLAVNDDFTYNTADEVETRIEGQSLFSDNPVTTKFMYDCTVGIHTPVQATAINVYPNPATEFISLENSSFSGVVKVYDMAGKVVMNQNMTTAASTLDVRSLKAGVYYVEMTNNSKTFKGKFLKN